MNNKITEFRNLYEVRKTVRFELKPSKETLEKLNKQKIFDSPHFKSKIFVKSSEEQKGAEKKIENYQFTVNFAELKNFVEKCDEKIKQIKEIKKHILENPQILWTVWINPEAIKIIDKDLKYKLQEKKSWEKSFWNEISQKQSKATVKWKRGDFLTLDDIDAYFEEVRSGKEKKGIAGEFTSQVLKEIDFFLNQYETRKRQLLMDQDTQTISFLKKRELIARIRNFFGMVLKLERIFSLFNPEYVNDKQIFDKNLKKLFDSYKNNLSQIITDIETLFAESNLYLHNNIQRRFSLNIRAINPNPESTDKTENQKITEETILEKIEKLENEILNLKNEKATLKVERKGKDETYKKLEWNNILNQLNPADKESLFSQLSELRRDLEEVQITHYAVLIEKQGNFYVAMENKRQQNNDIKKTNEFSLFTLPKGLTCKALKYNVLTFNALRRLCLEEKSSMKTKYFLNLENTSWKESISQGKRTREVNRNWKDEKYFQDLMKYLQKITKDNSSKIGVSFTESQYQEWKACKKFEELETLIDKQGYQTTWQDISWEELQKKESIELFQLYNKDFLLDENFATSDEDREKIERLNKAKEVLGEKFVPKQQKTDRKNDIYTIYWQNFFKDKTAEEWRIRPEGKFYVRLKDDLESTQRKISNDEKTNKARFFENKIFADFQLVANPTIDKVKARAKTKEEIREHIEEMNKLHKQDEQEFYILGLDRGLNSLATYCLLDSKPQIIKSDKNEKLYEKGEENYDEQEDFVCGDWSLVNSKGGFVKRKKCKFSDENGDLIGFWSVVFSKLKKFYEFEKKENFGVKEYVEQFTEKDDCFYIDTKDKVRLCILKEKNNEGQNFEIKKIKNEIQKKEDGRPLQDPQGKNIFQEHEKIVYIVDENRNRVFDYVLSFYVEKAKRIFALHKQQTLDSKFQYTEEDMGALLFESVDELKEGFTSFVVGAIVMMAQKIAHDKKKKLYIALEDLSNYGIDKKPNQQNDNSPSFKEKAFEKNLSVLVYQKLENALVKKFNYVETKASSNALNRTQFSPKIKRIEDIKYFQTINKLGNLIFVDPANTSRQCPNPICGAIATRSHDASDSVVCTKCKFSTKEPVDKKGFDFIDGGDTLAAYNIAKRGLEQLQK